MSDQDADLRRGTFLAIFCYLFWGILPIYFKMMGDVSPPEIVAHRVGWSMAFLLLLVLLRRALPDVVGLMSNWRVLLALTGSSLLIGFNWVIYIWAVTEGHILASSLGYFLNPLVTVSLGVVVLKEKLRPGQMLAIGFAIIGVANLAFAALDTLWISVILALTFAFYGLIRKLTPVEAVAGLTIETMVLLPFALVYLIWLHHHGGLAFGQHVRSTVLLMLTGIASSVPLLLFTQAARHLPFATLGLLQYLTPLLLFVIGFLVYGEPMGMGRLISFVLIWVGLAVFTHDALRHARGRAAARREARG